MKIRLNRYLFSDIFPDPPYYSSELTIAAQVWMHSIVNFLPDYTNFTFEIEKDEDGESIVVYGEKKAKQKPTKEERIKKLIEQGKKLGVDLIAVDPEMRNTK